jgi:hypothetical protein
MGDYPNFYFQSKHYAVEPELMPVVGVARCSRPLPARHSKLRGCADHWDFVFACMPSPINHRMASDREGLSGCILRQLSIDSRNCGLIVTATTGSYPILGLPRLFGNTVIGPDMLSPTLPDLPFVMIGDVNTGTNDLDIEGTGTRFDCADPFEDLSREACLTDLWRAVAKQISERATGEWNASGGLACLQGPHLGDDAACAQVRQISQGQKGLEARSIEPLEGAAPHR